MDAIEIRRAFFSATRRVRCNAKGRKACLTSDMVSRQYKSQTDKVSEFFSQKRKQNTILRKRAAIGGK